jgi:hypothetical protein
MTTYANRYSTYVQDYTDGPTRVVITTQGIIKCAIAAFLIWAGVHYRHASCNHPLALWLLVMGAAWLGFLMLALLSVVASNGSDGATVTLAVCFPCILCGLCLAGPFLVVWFILGNVWTYTSSRDRCDRTLYDITFWYLIFLYAWALISCCCYGGRRYSQDFSREPLLPAGGIVHHRI